jgi:hypothetical protein
LTIDLQDLIAADPEIELILSNATSYRRARHGVGRVNETVRRRLHRQLGRLIGPGRWRHHDLLSAAPAYETARAELNRRLDGMPAATGAAS